MLTTASNLIHQNKVFAWLGFGTAAILSIPLIAMQFTSDVQWGIEDFTAAAMLLFGMGSVFVLVARVVPVKYLLPTAAIFAFAVMLMWIHLAVGIVDSWPLAGS